MIDEKGNILGQVNAAKVKKAVVGRKSKCCFYCSASSVLPALRVCQYLCTGCMYTYSRQRTSRGGALAHSTEARYIVGVVFFME
jgi:transposase-like protein